MRKTVLVMAFVAGLGGTAISLLAADAQPAAGSDVADATEQFADSAPLPPPAGGHFDAGKPAPHAWQHGGPMRHMMHAMALVYPAQDKQLSTADVQKIAEAFLLWKGNHSWKVTNVTENGDKIAFSFATDKDSVIASFAMDRHTGRLDRTS